MRVVVIGGSGFLGRNIISYLTKRDYEVVCCDLVRPMGMEAAVEYYNPSQLQDYHEILQKDDVVIYLLCTNIPATSNMSLSDGINENILMAVQFFDICVATGVRKIIYSSSGGAVYGNISDLHPIPESFMVHPRSTYGIQKLTVEYYLSLYRQIYGIEAISLRISNPYGPWQKPFRGQGLISTFLASILIDEEKPINIWGEGNDVRDYIYVSDLVRAIESAITYSGDKEIFNIGSGCGYSILEVVDAIEKVTGKRFINRRHIENSNGEVNYSVLDTSLAQKELNWKAKTSLYEGIAELMTYWNNATSEFIG